MNMRRVGLFVLVGCLAGSSAWATDAPRANRMQGYSGPPPCPMSRAEICGVAYTIPFGMPGTLQTVHLPERYVIENATFQCVTNGYSSFYKIVNGDVANCTIKTCSPDTVTVCGIPILLQGEAKIGEVVHMPLSDELVDRTKVPASFTLAARCNARDGRARFEADRPDTLSCNAFRCQPTVLNACGSEVNVGVSAVFGSVLNFATAAGQPVTVRCLNNVRGVPHFAVTDFACN